MKLVTLMSKIQPSVSLFCTVQKSANLSAKRRKTWWEKNDCERNMYTVLAWCITTKYIKQIFKKIVMVSYNHLFIIMSIMYVFKYSQYTSYINFNMAWINYLICCPFCKYEFIFLSVCTIDKRFAWTTHNARHILSHGTTP